MKLLIDNLATVPKMLTTWVSVLAIALGSLPEGTQQQLIGTVVPPERLPLALGLLYLVTRVIKQPSVSGKPDPAPPDQ